MPLALLALVAATPIALHAKIERLIEKSFSVPNGGLLTVETQGGDIRVVPGAGSEVKVVAKQVFRKAETEAEADTVAADLQMTIEQTGGNVTAVAKYEKKAAGMVWGGWPPVQVSFTVTVPTTYNVTLRTSGGDVTVGDLQGEARARTSGGDISLGRIAGVVDASTSGGDVTLQEGAKSAKLSTSGGDIRIAKVVGDTEARTSGGDIEVGEVGGRLDAHTSGGNVKARLNGPLAGDCSLGTSGGNVSVSLVRGASFDLDASTSGGGVEANGLTIAIEKGGVGKSRLAGKVNGGGPELKLRTSGGNIRVKAD